VKFLVYILRSQKEAERYYVGFTTNLEQRLNEHNNGKSIYTKPWLPWELDTYIVFRSEKKAKAFEKYLKSGLGHAFFRKHLI
jgi:predicted GIY-YIG superfamily endonuclease